MHHCERKQITNLTFEVVLRRAAEHLSGGYVEVDEDVLERRSVAGLGAPALLDEQPEPLWARGGDGEVQGVTPHSPDDG